MGSGATHTADRLKINAPLSGVRTVVDLSHVNRQFLLESGAFSALSEIDLRIQAGRLVALTGSSGSGKSTLLNLIAGLDRPTSGRVLVAGVDLSGFDENQLSTFRGKHIGVVFQFFQLLPTLTALENVLLAMDLVGAVPARERRSRALSLLAKVGIEDQANKFPSSLSGGQQQRVAIARALANDPPLIVADEPTGNLDSQSAGTVFAAFRALSDEGKTIIVATHERQFPIAVDQTVELRDGRIVAVKGQSAGLNDDRGETCPA